MDQAPDPTLPITISPNATPYQDLITSEFNQQPLFMALVGLYTGAIADITALIESIPSAFDLNNAIGAQLDIVGQWIGQTRIIGTILTLGYFGFADDPVALTMGELHNASFNSQYAGLFFELGGTYQSNTTVLADGDYLTLLQAIIARNQSDGLIDSLEAGLEAIFGSPCAIYDTGAMVLNINVPVNVSPVTEALVRQLDILPRPAGVKIGSITFPST
jgi:hypothetical protein